MSFKFMKIPWPDGEAKAYVIKIYKPAAGSMVIGKTVYRMYRPVVDKVIGEEVINITTYTKMTVNGLIDDAKVIVHAHDFRPVSYLTRLSSPQGNAQLEANYSKNKVKATFSAECQPSARIIKLKLPDDYYDNSSITQIFRCIDWTKGRWEKFSIVNMMNGQIYSAVAGLVGEEQVTVPAGTFQCVRIRLTIDNTGQGNSQQFFLYNKEPPYFLVKTIFGAQTVELANDNI